MKMFRKDEGFTLVELMVVVLIIGILVAIAIPVFLNASANAQRKSCQANQRTWSGALSTYNANAGVDYAFLAAGGELGSAAMTAGADGLGEELFGTGSAAVIKTVPVCPTKDGDGVYFIDGNGVIDGDTGAHAWTAADHELGSAQ